MHRLLSTTCLVLFLITSPAFAAGLDAPDEAVIGTQIEVTWDGPGDHYDVIWVSRPDTPDDVKGTGRALINHGRNPVQVTVPEVPGTYELRYWLRSEGRVLVRRPLQVIDVPTFLTAPDAADAGATLEVDWQGPGNRYDRIILVPAGSPEGAEASAKVFVSGRHARQLLLPEAPGDYELRYQTATLRRTLAQRPLTLLPVTANLEAPDSAQLGQLIQVHWQGPGHKGDWLGLYPKVGQDVAKPIARFTFHKRPTSPIYLHVPDEPGDYELHYVTRQDWKILDVRPIVVEATPASEDAVRANSKP